MWDYSYGCLLVEMLLSAAHGGTVLGLMWRGAIAEKNSKYCPR
jgi:hypothetical protein